MLLLSAGAPDSADTRRLGLHALIAAESPAARGNVATRTMAASRRAVCGGDAAGGGGEEEDEGCWVSYGWRRGLRRLPPPIPSHRALARTADGRLVISREEPGAHHVRARKVEDRLVLELVDDGATAPPPPQQRRRRSHPSTTQESSAPAAEAHEEAGLHPALQAPPPTITLAAVGSASPPPLKLQAQGCLEGAIRAAAPLRRMSMTLPRTVH